MNKAPASLTLIADPDAEAGALESLPPTENLEILSLRDLISSGRKFSPIDKVICSSESVLDALIPALSTEDSRIQAIEQMKDKRRFRQLVSTVFPDFLFRELVPADLRNLVLDPSRRYVLKPNKGCFGTGVQIIQGDEDLQLVGDQIQKEISANKAVFSDQVLSEDSLILEEYIEGEEYAVDVFFDENGTMSIVNIFHHPMPKNPSYLHMLYYSSAHVHELISPLARNFFNQLGAVLDLSLMPIHSEFRLSNGKLIPIELNPMRFGGMGLSNLSFHTLNSNALSAFIAGQEPEWSEIWEGKQESAQIFFIAYNGDQVNRHKFGPDWFSFRKNFSDIKLEIPFDYQKQLAFGILFLEEPQSRVEELLNIEFNEFFEPLK